MHREDEVNANVRRFLVAAVLALPLLQSSSFATSCRDAAPCGTEGERALSAEDCTLLWVSRVLNTIVVQSRDLPKFATPALNRLAVGDSSFLREESFCENDIAVIVEFGSEKIF